MTDQRALTREKFCALMRVPETDISACASDVFAPDIVLDIAHPVNQLVGIEAVVEGFLLPLRRSLAHVYRRDEIFIGAQNRRAERGNWTASVTHYVGNHHSSLYGIEPTNRVAFLRSGEFYRLDGGHIVEGKLIVDFLDLMRQAGRFPLPLMLGSEILFPGPATHDGVLPEDGDGEASLDIIEGMISDLHAFDPNTFTSTGQTGSGGYWHDDMMWYGPAGIGSNFRWEGFVKDHRESFLKAFPDRHGGNHYCRIGDGHYAAISGWPSMTMTHQGDYLGVKATGKALTLRVMDFYRCAEGQIMENWVLLDYLDLFQQMGIDLLAISQSLQPVRS